jgi:hypothetical protein
VRNTAIVVALLDTLLFAACDNNKTPTTPAPTQIDVTGRWAGDLSFQGVTARTTWTLTQSGNAVTGPVILALPSGTVLLNGSLTGTMTGPSLAYTIAVAPGGIPLQPSCTGQLGGTMTVTQLTTSTMSGTIGVTTSTCPIQFSSSTLVLTKQ